MSIVATMSLHPRLLGLFDACPRLQDGEARWRLRAGVEQS